MGSKRRIETIAKTTVTTTVAHINNFSTLLLLLYTSPDPPNADDKPLPCICNKTKDISKIETIISIIFKISISRIISFLYLTLQVYFCISHDKNETIRDCKNDTNIKAKRVLK